MLIRSAGAIPFPRILDAFSTDFHDDVLAGPSYSAPIKPMMTYIDLPPRFDWTNQHDGLVILLTVHLESRL